MNGNDKPEKGSSTPEDTRENELLLEAIQRGDRDAEHALVMRFMRPVKAMLLARSRNADATPDLVQDVMIEVICALRKGQLRDPARLPAFVSGVARNLLNNYFRGSARQPESLEFPDDLPDVKSAQEKFHDNEQESQAMKAISGLDPIDRKILQMTLVDGLKPGVIADQLNLKAEVVRQRKLRATRRVINLVQSLSQNRSGIHLLTRREP